MFRVFLVAAAVLLCLVPCTTTARGILGGEADFEFVNFGHLLRRFSTADGKGPVTDDQIDEFGWPLVDVQACIFDARPAYAWAPPMDDPQALQADYSGVWKLQLTGYADLAVDPQSGDIGISLLNSTYDPHTNLLSAFLEFADGVYPKVANLLVLTFTNTRRNATAVNGTGFSDLRVIHPDYLDRPNQLFTDGWAKLHAPFDHLRFMGATGTNSYTWQCGGDDAFACSVIEWSDRALPSYAFPGLCKGCVGQPWEYVLLAANELNKDIWINVPVTASSPTVKGNNTSSNPKDTYVYQMAELFKNGNENTGGVGLKPNLNIFIEHSNEVWNFGFKQFGLNQAAAEYEVTQSQGKSNLANDAVPWENCTFVPGLAKQPNAQCWGHRRHARRVYEIGKVFEEVFGAGSLNNRIRMVYASWSIYPGPYFNNTLTWLEKEYGDVSKYIYAMAPTAYFAPDKSWVEKYPSMTPSAIAKLFSQAATNNTAMVQTFAALKEHFKVKLASYEAGPGDDVGGQFKKPGPALSNFILANRDPAMEPAVIHSCKDVWWGNGGDIYHQFSIHGKCSRYGCWGAQEFYPRNDAKFTPSPKFQGNLELLGQSVADLEAAVQSREPAVDPRTHAHTDTATAQEA